MRLIVKRAFKDHTNTQRKPGDDFPEADQLDPEYRAALIEQGETEEIEGDDPPTMVKRFHNGRLVSDERASDVMKREKIERDQDTKKEKAEALDNRGIQ